jgi:hypothetical protein
MNPPEIIDGALVGDCPPSGRTQHLVDGNLCPPPKGLVIASTAKDSSCSLFYCDETWECINDTLHRSFDDARRYAEGEYPGVSSKGIKVL